MTTKYEYCDDTPDYHLHIDAVGVLLAQTFTPSIDHYITQVKLDMAKEVALVDDIIIQIRSTSAGLPTTTILTIGSISAVNIPISHALVTCLINPYKVISGTKYAIVPYKNTAIGSLLWYQKYGFATYSGGDACTWIGTAWDNKGGSDFIFEEWGVTDLSSKGVVKSSSRNPGNLSFGSQNPGSIIYGGIS